MNLFKIPLFLLILLVNSSAVHAAVFFSGTADTSVVCDAGSIADSLTCSAIAVKSELVIPARTDSIKTSKFRSKKIIAAILSFPVPFGLLGLHRVFLGTKPYIPFVYIGTLGGCFLVLPMIDFITILSADEETFRHFENNPKVFMWSH
jgi:TM2 domain-containing membrane protein YozV